MTRTIESRPLTRGVHHVGLTVPDVTRARDFFVEALGFRQVGEVPDYPAVFISDGTTMLTLWQAANPAAAIGFDRRNVIGLHHLALAVDSPGLDDLHERLSERPDVIMEFAPEPVGDLPTRHMMCNIPGGIRVEFLEADPGEPA